MRGRLRSSELAIRARVQPLQPCLLSEEIYPRRLSWQWRDPQERTSLLLVQQGRCIVEPQHAALQLLQAEGTNALALTQPAHDLTISHAPCRMVRLVLPVGSVLQGAGALSVDLALMVPMLQLLEQALQHPAQAHTRDELGSTLLAYLLDRLAAAGCGVQLPQLTVATDPLQQLEQWLALHLTEPLELADLAAAVNLSPRRLQELCRARHGCTPMDLLRQQRLALLAVQLRDPACAHVSLRGLMDALQLSDSAATRQAFVRHYGCTPAEYRRGAKAPAAV